MLIPLSFRKLLSRIVCKILPYSFRWQLLSIIAGDRPIVINCIHVENITSDAIKRISDNNIRVFKIIPCKNDAIIDSVHAISDYSYNVPIPQ